ncbi:hypothetical protein SB461_29390 [Burkholderia cenocepacia]|uniref:hypothetical protein n=1 Tax=Burkholderia cepacia complex TaxID=87882 RepID=UPI002B2505CC|nr:hypothetical protein [Burkholderia cenocepacia]MEB2610613.1 hypothetical protein [Burkholderia cenocepacia]
MAPSGKAERVRKRILKVMADKSDWTIPELASELELSIAQVRSAVRVLIDAHQIYQSSRIESLHKNTYRIVLFDDVVVDVRFVELTHDNKSERRVKIDRRRRCETTAPSVDHDEALSDAIFAMVRASRKSS